MRRALGDRYAIERVLGYGGMAIVYLAQDLKHHRQVAIKVLKPDVAAALGPERFVREIELAGGACAPQHPRAPRFGRGRLRDRYLVTNVEPSPRRR